MRRVLCAPTPGFCTILPQDNEMRVGTDVETGMQALLKKLVRQGSRL